MSNFIYQPSEDSDFLMHHGIKGQKWGIENGPPYPLSRRDYSALEKKMNNINQLSEHANYRRDILRNLKHIYMKIKVINICTDMV